MSYQKDCRWFTGYKPCKYKRSCTNCPNVSKVSHHIAIVSLDAMGAVIRATCLLPAINRKYPDAHITWITYPQCTALLKNNPMTDRIISFNAQSVPLLSKLRFDILFAVDKSLEAGGLSETIQADKKFGFGLSETGVIQPFTDEASYQYDVGLNDELKFYKNQKPETQQITESMGLEWKRDPYILELTQEESDQSQKIRHSMLNPDPKRQQPLSGVIGYNTGCSLLFPNKKLTVEKSIEQIRQWRKNFPDHSVALLGGPEDTDRQVQMKDAFKDDPLVINTPTRDGLRQGLVWMNAADMVFSGCSLGMHMAIALKKKVIAWFGVSCLQEIDLYDRGIRIQSDVSCSPCWKKQCNETIMCYDRVDLVKVMDATKKLLTTD